MASRSSHAAHTYTPEPTRPLLEQMRPSPASALRQKESTFFFSPPVFPTKSRPALEISSPRRHIKQDHRLPFSKSSVLLVYNVPRQGCMVRNHPHLISQSQLCQHSATCVVDAGWLAGRGMRWEFLSPQRSCEIIMSTRDNLHILFNVV